MLIAVLIGTVPPSIISDILPRLHIFSLNWLGPVTEVVWIPLIAYSIVRHGQMSVRAVATEALAVGMTVIFFLNIFVDFSLGVAGRVAAFAAFLGLAAYLFRASLREARQKEELRVLNGSLAETVAGQTREILRAYEGEKGARRELEKLCETKDQFIMITQHQIRLPVSRINSLARSMLEGGMSRTDSGCSNGRIGGASVRQSLLETAECAERLRGLVDDFLNISALKAGGQILKLSKTSLRPVAESAVRELRFDMEKSRLSVKLAGEEEDWPELAVDSGKMREVLLIILENAVKYNIDGGTITIEARTCKNGFELVVENTGAGLTEEDKAKVFGGHFYRGAEAKVRNPTGMGVGLCVARTIVRAHHGELSVESEGKGKGARVTIRLPIA